MTEESPKPTNSENLLIEAKQKLSDALVEFVATRNTSNLKVADILIWTQVNADPILREKLDAKFKVMDNAAKAFGQSDRDGVSIARLRHDPNKWDNEIPPYLNDPVAYLEDRSKALLSVLENISIA